MNTASSSVPAGRADAVARILTAAGELFGDHGYDAVSMHAIAARAGVSKANIFHHFSSKESLYLAVLRNACQESAERLHELGAETERFERRLSSYADTMLSSMLEHGQVQRLILRELLTDGEHRGQEFAEKVFGENFARLVAILRNGQTRGELRADLDPAMVATLLIGANVFFFEAREVLRHFRDVSFARDPGRYSAMLVDILLRGIASQPGQPKNKSAGA
jgi:TetR/AcrR family transcriptional regulator